MKFIKSPNIIFFIAFSLLAILYYDSILDKPPLNMHVFRQSDCLSLTTKYYEGASFFEPQMHTLLGDDLTSGKSAGEFPILYYVIGKLWSVFGKSFFLYRFVFLLILFWGLFSLFKTLRLFFKDVFWPLFITLLLFTSPTLVFYGVSYQTDAPAFCFGLVGIYYFVLYARQNKIKHLILFALLFALAGLIKVSSLLPFFVIGGLWGLEFIGVQLIKDKKIFHHKWISLVSFFGVLLLIYSWISYAEWYNNIHHFKYTFNDIYPLWETDNTDLLKGMKNHCSHLYFSRIVTYLIFFISIINLVRYKKTNKVSFYITLITLLGSITYFLLWGTLFGVHDYYYIPLLSLFLATIIPFLIEIYLKNKDLLNNLSVKSLAVSILIINILFCWAIMRLKIGKTNHAVLNLLIGNDDLIALLSWTSSDVNQTLVPLTRIEPKLQELGIKKSDKVIVLSDLSFNASLAFMDRDGWTNFKQYNKLEDIDVLKQKGAKYLFIHKNRLNDNQFITPLLDKKIGEFEDILILKL